MANIFFAGERAPSEEAIAALKKEIHSIFKGQFHIRIASDDGGSPLELSLGRENPSERLEQDLLEALPKSRFMGWRLIVIKCTPGYIDTMTKTKK
tara:strand:- start:1608 stop:1892 length:285 start_codon:yes stop_codon:yes gene_type:complete